MVEPKCDLKMEYAGPNEWRWRGIECIVKCLYCGKLCETTKEEEDRVEFICGNKSAETSCPVLSFFIDKKEIEKVFVKLHIQLDK